MSDAASSSVVIAAAGVCVAVIGWFVVNRQNNDRESRKELRARIDAAKANIENVLTANHSYLAESGHVPEKYAGVTSSLSILAAEIEAVRQWVGRSVRLPLRESLTWALVEFRQALTSQAQSAADFTEPSRRQLMLRSALAAGNLVAVLESFFNRYTGRPTLPVRIAAMMIRARDCYVHHRRNGGGRCKSLYYVQHRIQRRGRARIRLLIRDIRSA